MSTMTHIALTFLGFRGKPWWNVSLKFKFVSELQKKFFRGRISNIPSCPKRGISYRGRKFLDWNALFRILFHIPLIIDYVPESQEIWISNLYFWSSACWITLKLSKEWSFLWKEREWIGPSLLALSSGFQVRCTVMTSERETG